MNKLKIKQLLRKSGGAVTPELLMNMVDILDNLTSDTDSLRLKLTMPESIPDEELSISEFSTLIGCDKQDLIDAACGRKVSALVGGYGVDGSTALLPIMVTDVVADESVFDGNATNDEPVVPPANSIGGVSTLAYVPPEITDDSKYTKITLTRGSGFPITIEYNNNLNTWRLVA
jgi:hypothetical protein